VDNTSAAAIISATDTGAFTIGPASMATSLFQTVNGTLVGRATASQTQGIFAGGTIARLNANAYFDAAGNTERAITTQTGYASLLINSSAVSTDVALRLSTNSTNAQTANSAIVTTNQITVLEVTQAGAVTVGSTGNASSINHRVRGDLTVGVNNEGRTNESYSLFIEGQGASTNNNYSIKIDTVAGDGVQPSNSGGTIAGLHWNGSAYVYNTAIAWNNAGAVTVGPAAGLNAYSTVNTGLIMNATAGLAETGVINFKEKDTTPSSPTAGTEFKLYLKSDKIIFQYNDVGTVRYKYLDLFGTGVTWVHTTTAP
jgi:hypothetical protein